jgi:hypothetical protein
MRFTDLFRDRRGAATAEGAIVAMFMAMIFGAVIFAYRGYRDAAATVASPRRQIWPRALKGCPGPRETRLRAELDGYDDTAEDIAPMIAVHFRDVTENTLRQGDLRTETAPSVAGGRTAVFEERAQVACNTIPVDYAADIRPSVLDLFCETHPDAEWPEGCNPGIPE